MHPLRWVLHPTLLVLMGFLLAQGLQSLGFNTRLDWTVLYALAWYGLLPLIVYEIALRLNAEGLFRNLGLIVWLAIPLLLAQVGVAALLLYAGLGETQAFPLLAALLTATFLVANSPAVVVRVFEPLHLPARSLALPKGESLFGSVFALILASLLLQVAQQMEPLNSLQSFVYFTKLFAGSVFVGLLAGLLGLAVLHFARFPVLRGLLSVIGAYVTFVAADALLEVSGIVAVLVAGLVLNAYRQRTDLMSRRWLDTQWRWTARLASAFMFLLLGFSVYVPILLEQWQAVLWGIMGVLLARWVVLAGGFWVYGNVGKQPALKLHEQITLMLGGIKGMISILLVFALPVDADYSYTIQAVVYGVVLASLLVQVPLVHGWMWARRKPMPK